MIFLLTLNIITQYNKMSINLTYLANTLQTKSCDLFNDDGILIDDEIDTICLGHAIMEYIYNSDDSAYNYHQLSTLHTELMALCKEYNYTTEICINIQGCDTLVVKSVANIYNKIINIIKPVVQISRDRPLFLEPLSPITPKIYPMSEELPTGESPISDIYGFSVNLMPFDESILKSIIKQSTTSIMTCPHCEHLIYLNATT